MPGRASANELHDEVKVDLVGAVEDAVQLGEEGCDRFVYQVSLFLFSSLDHHTVAIHFDNDICLHIRQRLNNLCVIIISGVNGEIISLAVTDF